MNTFTDRYIRLKETHPDIGGKMPYEVQNTIINTLLLYKNKYGDYFSQLDRAAWTDFCHERIDEYDSQNKQFGDYIIDEFGTGTGNCIKKFALIDFLLQEISNISETKKEIPSFAEELNKGFEKVNYDYRIVNNHITPIADKEDVEEFEDAINNVPNNIKEHLSKAMLYLSTNPDYENSIKESISAVEAFCYTHTKNNVLTASLKILDKNNILHPRLKGAFEKLYCYSSEKDTGIRHGKAEIRASTTPTFYEAKFMLTVCSAFINYLRGKFANNINNPDEIGL